LIAESTQAASAAANDRPSWWRRRRQLLTQLSMPGCVCDSRMQALLYSDVTCAPTVLAMQVLF